jgi:hypothetical protein
MTTTIRSFGQAIDEAIRQHETTYPGSKVTSVRGCTPSTSTPGSFHVELDASHFSTSLCYYVGVHS